MFENDRACPIFYAWYLYHDVLHDTLSTKYDAHTTASIIRQLSNNNAITFYCNTPPSWCWPTCGLSSLVHRVKRIKRGH